METENINTEKIEENIEPIIEDPKAVLTALERAKGDAKKFREEKEKLELTLNSKEEIITKYNEKLLKEKIMQKISSEGVKDGDRLLKFIDFNTVKFDENLEIQGFDEQFNQLKQDLPEIFDPKLRVGGQADGAMSTSVNTRVSVSEMQARKILGRI